jgi:hypothetical protein
MIFQSAQIWGNLISSAVLQRSDKSSSNSTNSSGYDVSEICGANDCGGGMIRFIVVLIDTKYSREMYVQRNYTKHSREMYVQLIIV